MAFALLAAIAALAATPVQADELDRQVREVAAALQCPVCQNVSVADSPSELAEQMRGVVRARLAAGDSREQVLAYFVERYGEEVLLDPPKRGFTLLVWAVPLLGLIAAGSALAVAMARRTRRSLEAAG